MAYREELTLKAKGLHTYAESLEAVPPGSLKEAVNVVIDKTHIISPRRGYEKLPGDIAGSVGSLHSFTASDSSNTLIAHRDGDTLARYDDTTETWTDYTGTYLPPTSAEVVRSVESNKNFYFTTNKGVQKLDAPSADVLDAGAPEALNLEYLSEVAGDAVLDTNFVAYRALWGYKDLNDNLILGAPSSRLVYENTSGGNVALTLRAYIPVGSVDESWFIQLYRTPNSAVEPNDIMQLTLERNPTAGDLTNGYIDLQDLNPDSLLGAELYTNATQEGITQANTQPPQCVDMALFQNHMFYANTESRYEQEITLLGLLSNGNTITIDGVVYTGAATEDASLDQFQVTGHPGTISQQIEATARSLIRVLNDVDSSNTRLWGAYNSLENELPGKMRFYERDYGDAPNFTAISSVGAKFSPNLTTTQTATNNKNPNRIYYSKFQEPEAVPLLNYFEVGPANDRIIRILPLRANLLIFTTRAIYQLTGSTSSTFQVSLFDNTTRLLAPETLVALNNTACGLFDQGVARVSGSSVQIISRPIEGDLLELRGAAGSKLADLAFGISYESDRKYMLAIPDSDSATINSLFYVFNTATESWTTYDLQKSAGIVRPSDDKLYLAQPGQISRERKDFSATDYAEEAIDVEVMAVSTDKLTLTLTTAADIRAGYMFVSGDTKYSVIESVDSLASTITVVDPLNWSTGAAEVRPYISTTIVWNPATANSPNLLKQWAECTLLVETPLQDATLSFSTPTSGGFEGVEIVDTAEGPWGLFPWGSVAWGGDPYKTRYRTYVPRNKQKETFIIAKLTQNTVYNSFEVSGLSFYYRPISNRTAK